MSDHDTKIPMLDKAAELDAAQRAGLITKSRAAGLLAEFAELDVLAEEIQAAYKGVPDRERPTGRCPPCCTFR